MVPTTATRIPLQPLLTLALQLQAYRDIAEGNESELETLLQMLVSTIKTKSTSVHEETIFHAAGPELMQLMVDALNTEHDLALSTDDLMHAFTPHGLAMSLHAQLSTYYYS